MKTAVVLPAVVLAPFLAFTLYCAYTGGLLGFVGHQLSAPWGVQVLLDLMLALSMFVFWMVPDARQRGLAAWPFAVIVLTCGSVGALTYLLVRGLKGAPEDRAASISASV